MRTLFNNKDYSALSIILLIVVYFISVLIFTRNSPIADDYALINFLNEYAKSDETFNLLSEIISQHNEHRIATTRIIILLYHLFNGAINFKILAFIGNLSILVIFYIYYKHISLNNLYNKNILIIVGCFLFQYGAAESMIWAQTAISNYLVISLFILSLHFVSKRKDLDVLIAFILSFIAVYTQGNGLLVPFISILYLLCQRKYYLSSLYSIGTLLLLFVYFIDYQTPSYHSDPFDAINHIGRVLIIGLSFTGSAFGLGGSSYPIITKISLVPTIIVGLLIWVITIYSFLSRQYRDGNIFVWINIFVILSALLVATGRFETDISRGLVSRYHIYSNLGVISSFLLLMKMKNVFSISNNKIDLYVKWGKNLSLIFVVMTFLLLPYYYFISYGDLKNGGILHPDPIWAKQVLMESSKLGIYNNSNRN